MEISPSTDPTTAGSVAPSARPAGPSRRGAAPRDHRATATPASTTTSGCATRTSPEVDGLPRGRERLHRRRGPPTSPTCASRSSTRSRPAPRRPTCRCRPATAAGGTTAAPSRASEYGASCRVPVARPGRLDAAAAGRGRAPDEPALPGEQVLLDLDALAEGHEFFSLGGVVGQPRRHAARLLAPTSSATSATRSGSRTCAPASCCPTRSPASSAAPPGTATAAPLLHDRRRVLAPRQGLAAPARHRPGRRRAGPPRDRRALLGRRRPHPQRPVPGDRRRLQDHLGVPLPRRRRPDGGLPGRSPRAARASSTASSTR